MVNTDRPYWLVGMTEMTRTFGLELLESVLANFQPVFYKVIISYFHYNFLKFNGAYKIHINSFIKLKQYSVN